MFVQEAGMLTELVNQAEGVATTGIQYLSDGTKSERMDEGTPLLTMETMQLPTVPRLLMLQSKAGTL